MKRGGAVLQRGSALRGRRIPARWRPACWLVPVLAAASLSACASINDKLAGAMSQAPAVGEPTDTPPRASEAMAYPAVHDIPPPRASVLLTGLEQKKYEDELLAAREQQRMATGEAAEKPEAKPEAKPQSKSQARKPTGSKTVARKQPESGPPPPQPATQPAYIPPASGRAIY